MPNLLWICGELVLVGGLAFAIAYALQRWSSSFHRVAPPRPGSPFKFSNGLGMLRTRLASVHDDSWRFDPPILSSGSIDLEVGRTMLGEYASSNGVMRFRTELIEIEESGHFSLAIPGRTHIYERRSEPRNSYAGYVSIEHCDSTCIDLSALGGRFETEYDAKKGERVRLDFPQITDPVFGWVLETYPKQIRVRFEERLPYLK